MLDRSAIIFLLSFCFMGSLVVAQSPAEATALDELREAWNLSEWWSGDASQACELNWWGITCENGSVVSLAITNWVPGHVVLNGSIPANISQLVNLQELLLDANHLTGPIPSSLGQLTGLVNLSLTNNQLNGSVPASLGDLYNLKLLYLVNNQLSGQLPSDLANLTKLESCDLRSNEFECPAPSNLPTACTRFPWCKKATWISRYWWVLAGVGLITVLVLATASIVLLRTRSSSALDERTPLVN